MGGLHSLTIEEKNAQANALAAELLGLANGSRPDIATAALMIPLSGCIASAPPELGDKLLAKVGTLVENMVGQFRSHLDEAEADGRLALFAAEAEGRA